MQKPGGMQHTQIYNQPALSEEALRTLVEMDPADVEGISLEWEVDNEAICHRRFVMVVVQGGLIERVRYCAGLRTAILDAQKTADDMPFDRETDDIRIYDEDGDEVYDPAEPGLTRRGKHGCVSLPALRCGGTGQGVPGRRLRNVRQHDGADRKGAADCA